MENKKIIESLSNIMTEIGAIGKSRKSMGVDFAYRGIDDVMNELHPLLSKNQVLTVPEVVEHHREERLTSKSKTMIYSIMTVKIHFIAVDGSEVVATVVGEGMDTSDKASNKALAVAYKYACFQVLCIPTEDMAKADPDGYIPEESRPSIAQLRTYIGNCDTLDDFAAMKANWGVYIAQDVELSAYANARYAEIKKGGEA